MKTLSTPLLASAIIAMVGLIPAAFAGKPWPREVEENPALVRAAQLMKVRTCV